MRPLLAQLESGCFFGIFLARLPPPRRPPELDTQRDAAGGPLTLNSFNILIYFGGGGQSLSVHFEKGILVDKVPCCDVCPLRVD